VESDESVANFDPEFTGMSMADLDLLEDSDFDEHDTSDAWVDSASLSASGMHTHHGPLGSDLVLANMQSSEAKKPIEIKKKRKGLQDTLSISVQDKFKGFSFMGESLANNGFLNSMARERQFDEEAVAEGETHFEDNGRYGRRGRMVNDMELD
jgi:serine/threonine protein kinase SCH9